MPQVCIGFQKRKRDRVVDSRTDALFFQSSDNSRSMADADNIQMIDMSSIREYFGRLDDAAQSVIIQFRYCTPSVCPWFEISQFNVENCRLHTVEPAVHSFEFMIIFFNPAMIGVHAGFFSQVIVIRENGASITVCSQVFPWEETETG